MDATVRTHKMPAIGLNDSDIDVVGQKSWFKVLGEYGPGAPGSSPTILRASHNQYEETPDIRLDEPIRHKSSFWNYLWESDITAEEYVEIATDELGDNPPAYTEFIPPHSEHIQNYVSDLEAVRNDGRYPDHLHRLALYNENPERDSETLYGIEFSRGFPGRDNLIQLLTIVRRDDTLRHLFGESTSYSEDEVEDIWQEVQEGHNDARIAPGTVS